MSAPKTVAQGPSKGQEVETSRGRADRLIEWLRSYAARRLNARIMDERRCVPPHVVLDFGNQGLFGLQAPAAYGGLELRTADTMRIFEQLAAIDFTLASMVGIHNGLGMRTIQRFASPALRDELMPQLASGRQLAAFAITEPGAGSNPNAIQATAQQMPDGWRVRAEKRWIGLASWAGVITVFAKGVDAKGNTLGTVALALRENADGLRQGPESLTMGVRGIVQNTVFVDDALVPHRDLLGKPGEGMAVAQDAMMFCRLGLAAISVGGMKRCAQLMARYASRRIVATGKLIDNPVTIARLQETLSAIEATEALVHKMANWIDNGHDVPVEAYVACKTSGPEFLWQAADHLMQMLGGRGYVETNLVPQLFRDARLLRIFEGPTETLNAFLGANVLQRPESLMRLLAQGFQAPEIADDLHSVVGLMRDQAMRRAKAFNTVVPTQWLCFQAGELATAAILWAAVADRDRHSRGACADAVAWAQQRFERLRDAALCNTGSQHATAANIADRIAAFQKHIGDIEQVLPGEDAQLDEYLQKEIRPQAPRPPAPQAQTV